MTFRPPSGLTATETVNEFDLQGYDFGDSEKQYVQGGALNLIPLPDTGIAHDPVQYGWPHVDWEQVDYFINPPGMTNWGFTSGDSAQPHWVPEGSWLVLLADDTGTLSYIRQASDESGTFWSDNVDNSVGYVVQANVQLVGGQRSELVVDDGTRRRTLALWPDGIRIGDQPDLWVPLALSDPHAVRIAAKGNDMWLWTDEGMGFEDIGGYTGTSTTKEIILGQRGGYIGTLIVDELHQYHSGIVTDLHADSTPAYSTSYVLSTLPVFAPGRVLTGWDEVTFDLAGANDGTTQALVEYRSSSTPNWTQQGGATTLSTLPRQTIDISGISMAGDGTDQVRFKVQQLSTDGSGLPYGVTKVTVTANAQDAKLKIFPTWGPQFGSTAAIDVHPDYTNQVTFPVQANWPAEANTKLLYHFDESTGTVTDSSGNSHDGTIPGGAASNTLQGENGWLGHGIHVVDGNGQVDVPVTADLDYDGDVTISFYTKAYTRSSDGLIWDHKSGSRGVEIRVNTSGQLETFVSNGGGSDTTATYTGPLIGANSWVMVWVKLLKATSKIRMKVSTGDWEEFATAGQDYWTGLTGTGADMLVGCWGTLDEFQWYAGSRDETTWDTLGRRDVKRQSPTSHTVFVDGDAITGERVNYYHPARIYVNMPPQDPGEAVVWVEDTTGTKHYVDAGYRYSRAYEVDVSSELAAAQACTTRSPFRMGYSVAEGDVNLALVQGPELSVGSHMSRVGLEHLEATNLAAHRQGQFALTQGDTGAGNFAYSATVDTSELLISTKSVTRRGFNQGRPLFYKYLVGRGRHYVYNLDAFDDTDTEIVRRSLYVQDQFGSAVPIEDFPWEIDISRNDFHGNLLPANTFSVVIYTEIPGATDRTFFLVYNAVDARRDWERQDSRREAINPVPMFQRDAGLAGDFQYDVTLEDTGYYSLTVTK